LVRSRRNYRRLVAASTISNLGDGVSQIAYPWLASVVTRNPLLIALIAVAQRLPWLVVSLPVGVLTDRRDRRRLMIVANSARAVLTVLVALAVAGLGHDLPGPDQLDLVVGTRAGLYSILLVATLLLGTAEVVYDNSAQTLMPSVVEADDLERSNGRLYAAELVSNQFAGPPLGSVLLAAGFAVPFFVDAGTFAVAAGLVAAIVPVGSGARRAAATDPAPADPVVPAAPSGASWRTELREGVSWLWQHRFLRSLALTLAGTNLLSAMTTASFVLYAQEVLGAGAHEYALITIISALGGLAAGWLTGRIVGRVGAGTLLRAGLFTFTAVSLAMGAVSTWWLAALVLTVEYFVGTVWNVVTVSLRQTIIPDRLLGRVNSVYRFFAWGMIPVGAALGGLTVAVAQRFVSRELALRMPWWLAGGGYVLLISTFALSRLSAANVEAARRTARPTS